MPLRRLALVALCGAISTPLAAQVTGPSGVPLPQREGGVEGRYVTPRIAITPFIGARAAHTVVNNRETGDGNDLFQQRSEERRQGNPVFGVQVEGQLRGPYSLVGEVAFSPGSDFILQGQRFTNGEEVDRLPPTLVAGGPDYYLSKLAVAYRVADPTIDLRRYKPALFLSAGPALVVEDPSNGIDDGSGATDPVYSFAINFGVEGALALRASRLSLTFGLEDYLIFYNGSSEQERVQEQIDQDRDGLRVSVERGRANLFIPRVGLSFRF